MELKANLRKQINILNLNFKLGIVVYVFNSNTQETETDLWVSDQWGLHSELNLNLKT